MKSEKNCKLCGDLFLDHFFPRRLSCPKCREGGIGYLRGRDYTREKVRIRDNHICQSCGKKWEYGTRRFDVHHLNGLCGKKSRSCDSVTDINTLITLCHKCHFNHPQHSRLINR